MQDVATANGVARNHGHDRFGDAADQHLEVEHVEAPYSLLANLIGTDVAVITADLLVSA